MSPATKSRGPYPKLIAAVALGVLTLLTGLVLLQTAPTDAAHPRAVEAPASEPSREDRVSPATLSPIEGVGAATTEAGVAPDAEASLEGSAEVSAEAPESVSTTRPRKLKVRGILKADDGYVIARAKITPSYQRTSRVTSADPIDVELHAGSFEFTTRTRPKPTLLVCLAVEADEMLVATTHPKMPDANGEIDFGIIELVHKKGVLSGLVVAETGGALEAAAIALLSENGEAQSNTVSRVDGSFDVSIYDASRAKRIFVQKQSWAPEWVDVERFKNHASDRTIVLRRGARISGVVLDSVGRPAVKLDLVATLAEHMPSEQWESARRWLGQATTDAEGRFSFEDVPYQPLALWSSYSMGTRPESAWMRQAFTALTRFEVALPSTELPPLTRAGGSVQGKVVVQEVPDEAVKFVSLRNTATGQIAACGSMSGPDGLSLRDVEAGSYSLRVAINPTWFLEQSITVSGSETDLGTVTLELSAAKR